MIPAQAMVLLDSAGASRRLRSHERQTRDCPDMKMQASRMSLFCQEPKISCRFCMNIMINGNVALLTVQSRERITRLSNTAQELRVYSPASNGGQTRLSRTIPSGAQSQRRISLPGMERTMAAESSILRTRLESSLG